VFNPSAASLSDAAFRSGQLRRIESELFTGLAYHARVEGLTGTAERNFRLSAFPMHGYHGLSLVPLLMLTVIDAAPLLHEPLSEGRTFHALLPRAIGFSATLAALIHSAALLALGRSVAQ